MSGFARSASLRLDWRHRLVLVSAAAAGLATLVPDGSALRPPVVLWFMLIGPGLALVALVSKGDALTEITLGVALSMGIDTLLALAMLYAGVWRPTWALFALVALAVGATAVGAARPGTAAGRGGLI